MSVKRLSIILPAYNEQDNIALLLQEISEVAKNLPCPTEVIVVDDGSTDGTILEIERIAPDLIPPLDGVILVLLKDNYGQTIATSAGILKATGDVIVIMDADRQNDPADIPRLLTKLSDGFDVVSGWRKQRKDSYLTKVLPSKIANALITWSTKVKVHDLGCSLRAYRAWVLQALAKEGFQHRYLPIYCVAKGARICEVVVNHRPRTSGKSKYGLNRIFFVLRDLPLLVFIARYGSQPYRGFMNLVYLALLLGTIGIVCIRFNLSLFLTMLVFVLLIALLLYGLACVVNSAFRLTERHGTFVERSISEVKTFSVKVRR